VSKSPPDGYTILIAGTSLWIGPFLETAPYDPVTDFAPITLMTTSPNILFVHPSLPVKSVKELIALAKARPGELNYGSGATGASTHLSPELFKHMAGVDIVRVRYKTGSQRVNGLLGGEVQVQFESAAVMPHAKAGRLRALAITSARPSELAPGLPTIAASGVPGYAWEGMSGMFAPAKTPAAIIERLHQEIARAISQPEVKAKIFSAGEEVVGGSPEDFAAAIKSEMARLGKVIKEAGLREKQ
jgi:tripartite-type tricarboxylate transporter receptor subunit TctC